MSRLAECKTKKNAPTDLMAPQANDTDKKNSLPSNPISGKGICVIADDFTGAAEIAGIALRFGLKLDIHLSVAIFSGNGKFPEQNFSESDGAIFCTDSRSMPKADALNITALTLENMLQLKPSFIYKKIDSVLRGYVIEELQLQMEITGKRKALIVPANPSLGRTIRNREYLIGGKKITETDFANDPDFPVKSFLVEEILQDESLIIQSPVNRLPQKGIVVGETSTAADVEMWASKMDDSWVQIGAGDFFTALLKKRYQPRAVQEVFAPQLPFLYICGTALSERKLFIKDLQEKRGCVLYLDEMEDEKWFKKAEDIICRQGKLVMAINDPQKDSLSLRLDQAKAAKKIIEQTNAREIFIEGGSTAAAVLAELNIAFLRPTYEIAKGVVEMQAGDLFFIVKPGSYDLPKEIIRLFNN